MVRDGLCKVFHIWGKYNPADLLTKANQRQRINGDNDQAGYKSVCGFEPLRLGGMDSTQADIDGQELPQVDDQGQMIRYLHCIDQSETDSGYTFV